MYRWKKRKRRKQCRKKDVGGRDAEIAWVRGEKRLVPDMATLISAG